MTEAKSTRTVRRGRIFPEIQWTEEQKAQWRAERAEFRQHCSYSASIRRNPSNARPIQNK